MSIFGDGIYTTAARAIKGTKAWMAFDLTRRKTVRKVLSEALQEARRTAEGRGEAGDRLLEGQPAPPSVEDLTEKHLERIADAGLPILELLKLFGVQSLLTIADSLKGDPKA